MTFTLAHFSDPHIGPLPRTTWRVLLSKRITGYLNYQRNRKATLTNDLLLTLVNDMKAQNPDHVALTGDIVNIALDDEFTNARHWLESVGPPDLVSLVPGNHDAYVPGAVQRAKREWKPYFSGDDTGKGPVRFPYHRRREPIAVVALSTGVPTAPFMATGTLGNAQIKEAEAMLENLSHESCFRVIMIHHPPFVEKGRWYKRLTDHDAFNAMVRRVGAELILHGHTHRRNVMYLPGPSGKVPVVGVPSASSGLTGKHEPARYNLYKISREGDRWYCLQIERGVTPDGSIQELARRDL